MALGQQTYLQLTNSVLRRLGKAQVTSAAFATVADDSWPGIVKATLNEAITEIWKEHDWSTLMQARTFSGATRIVNLSTITTTPSGSFTDFGRDIGLYDTTNNRRLMGDWTGTLFARDINQDDTGIPGYYTIYYPSLQFDQAPSSTITYRLVYLRRPVLLTTVSTVSDLPDLCDLPIIWWSVWQIGATREDWDDQGQNAKKTFDETLARALGQDRRRMDRVHQLGSAFTQWTVWDVVPFPPRYDRS